MQAGTNLAALLTPLWPGVPLINYGPFRPPANAAMDVLGPLRKARTGSDPWHRPPGGRWEGCLVLPVPTHLLGRARRSAEVLPPLAGELLRAGHPAHR